MGRSVVACTLLLLCGCEVPYLERPSDVRHCHVLGCGMDEEHLVLVFSASGEPRREFRAQWRDVTPPVTLTCPSPPADGGASTAWSAGMYCWEGGLAIDKHFELDALNLQIVAHDPEESWSGVVATPLHEFWINGRGCGTPCLTKRADIHLGPHH